MVCSETSIICKKKYSNKKFLNKIKAKIKRLDKLNGFRRCVNNLFLEEYTLNFIIARKK